MNKQNSNTGKEFNEQFKRLNINHLNLRTSLGILGILLPFVLILGNGGKIEESISHYYYTNMSVVFTGVLIAFGMVLLSYKGYPKEEDERLSDNFITNFAGFLAIIVAIIPTACEFCDSGVPNWHNDSIRSKIHLIAAGIFILLMGFMSYNQFTKEPDSNKSKRRKSIYKVCGVIIFLMMLLLILKFSLKLYITKYDIFFAESIALISFGVAWLTKSKSLSWLGAE